jgi:hypothetical protein
MGPGRLWRVLGLAAAVTLAGVAWGQAGGSEALKPALRERVETSAAPVGLNLRDGAPGERVRGFVRGVSRDEVWVSPERDGEARAHRWTAFEARDVFGAFGRVLGREDAGAWAEVGVLMLMMGDPRRAERAFEASLRAEEGWRAAINAARTAQKTGRDVRVAFDAALEPAEDDNEAPGGGEAEGERAGRQGHVAPDRRAAGDAPMAGGERLWPELTAAERQREADRQRQLSWRLLNDAGIHDARLEETEHFMLFGDLSPGNMQRYARELDAMYRQLLVLLEMPPDAHLFHGKCPIFIFNNRETFVGFERDAFGFDASWAGGVCHPRGADVFVVFHKGADENRFRSVLIHETVHACMYRYKGPLRMPTWVEEGLADFVAGHLVRGSSEPSDHWNHVRTFLRDGGDAREVMALSYRDGSWPTDDAYPVSHMLVRHLIMHHGPGTRRWIDAVKQGEDRGRSMLKHLGMDEDALAAEFARVFLGESYYTPLR